MLSEDKASSTLSVHRASSSLSVQQATSALSEQCCYSSRPSSRLSRARASALVRLSLHALVGREHKPLLSSSSLSA